MVREVETFSEKKTTLGLVLLFGFFFPGLPLELIGKRARRIHDETFGGLGLGRVCLQICKGSFQYKEELV